MFLHPIPNPNKDLETLAASDPTFWNGIMLPSSVNSTNFVNYLINRSGRLYAWIQDAAKLKTAINQWCAYRIADWNRMETALTEQYNPIYNYFREELGSEEIAKHKGTKRSRNYKDSYEPGVVMTNTGNVMAYNSSTEKETGQTVVTPSGDPNVRSGLAADNYEIEQDVDANTYDKDVHSFDQRITQGNIGTTQTADMIANEIRIRTANSLLEIIAAEFEDKFCMQVY